MTQGRVTIEEVCVRLNARAADVVAAILPGNAFKSERGGKVWFLNPRRNDPSWDSACVFVRNGVWKDFSNAAADAGDMYKFVTQFACQGDSKRAFKWALDFLGLTGRAPDPAQTKAIAENRARLDAQAAERLANKRAYCMKLWLEARPLTPGDPVSDYLKARGIDVHALPDGAPSCLRFHRNLDMPTSRYWYDGKKTYVRRDGPFFAMLAMVSLEGLKDGLATVHATALMATPDGWRKAERGTRDDGKQMKAKEVFCEYRGGTIRLTKGASGAPLAKAPKGEWILVSEGIENALSAAVARPALRVAAAVAVANVGNIRLPDGLGGVVILADNDAADSQAQGALDRAQESLAARGIDVAIARVDPRFKDFNAALVGV